MTTVSESLFKSASVYDYVRAIRRVADGRVISNSVGDTMFIDFDLFAPYVIEDPISKSSLVLENAEPEKLLLKAPPEEYDISVPSEVSSWSERTERRSSGKPLYHLVCEFDSDTTKEDVLSVIGDVKEQFDSVLKSVDRLEKPFAEYEDFDECVSEHSDKEDPEAYCAQIHQNVTGEWPAEKARPMVNLLVDELNNAGMAAVSMWSTDSRFSIDFNIPAPFGVDGVRNTPMDSSIGGKGGEVTSVTLRLPTIRVDEGNREARRKVFDLADMCESAGEFAGRSRVREGAIRQGRRRGGSDEVDEYIIHVMLYGPIDIDEYDALADTVESVASTFYRNLSSVTDVVDTSLLKGEWVPYQGPNDGTGWTNGDDVVYDDRPPGDVDVSSLSPSVESELREETDVLPSREGVDVPESFDESVVVSEAQEALSRMPEDSVGQDALREEVYTAAEKLSESGVSLLSYRDAFVLARNIDNAGQSEALRSVGRQRERAAREEFVESVPVGEEFEGFEVFAVGGAVRDHYLEEEPEDIDVMAVPRPGRVDSPVESLSSRMDRLSQDNSVPVFVDSEGREVALPRTETSTGPGFQDFDLEVVDADLSVDEQIKRDSERRDQTIGTMSIDVRDGELVDPHNGRGDVLDRRIEPVNESFKDDPVRLLRAARFSPRLEFSVDEQIYEWGPEMRDGVQALPDERIIEEFEKTLQQADNPGRFLSLLDEFEVLDVSFPVVEESVDEVVEAVNSVRSETSDEAALFAAIGSAVSDSEKFADSHSLTNEQEGAVDVGDKLSDIDGSPESVLEVAEIVDSSSSVSPDDVSSVLSGLSVSDDVLVLFENAIDVVQSIDGRFVMEREDIEPSDIGSEIDGEEFGELIREARLEALSVEKVSKTPEGMPPDAQYVPPDEEVPEGWESAESDYGGTYAWEAENDSDSEDSSSSSGYSLPDDVEPEPSVRPMLFSTQEQLERVDGSFEEELFEYLEETGNESNNRHIQFYADEASFRGTDPSKENLSPESVDTVEEAMSSVVPQQSACYRNAQLVATQSTGIEYCEGVFVMENGAPILHAWVEVDGDVFDPTFVGADLSDPPTDGEYYGETFEEQEVVEVMSQEGMSRPIAMGPPRDDEQARIESGGGY